MAEYGVRLPIMTIAFTGGTIRQTATDKQSQTSSCGGIPTNKQLHTNSSRQSVSASFVIRGEQFDQLIACFTD